MSEALESTANVLPGTRQRIIDVARNLLSESGYHSVSMSDIARELGITKAALYYHFPSKTAIYAAVLDTVKGDMERLLAVALAEETPRARLEAIIESYLDYWMREMNVLSVLVGKLSQEETQLRDTFLQMREEVRALIRPVLEDATKDSPTFRNLDSGILVIMLTAMLDGLLLEASLLGGPLHSDTMKNQIEPALRLIGEQLGYL